MAGKTGRFAIIEQFLADGIDIMFGNPGTVEQGFLDALSEYPRMKYILTLQESVALLMGDGYARATKKPALVQIHSTPGLGNAIGALYQAKRGHAPIVVIGGDAGLGYMNMEAQMYGDLVGMAEPVTKWSTMVLDHRSLLRTLRRAIKVAATPPMGPVYICLPADVLDQPVTEPVRPTSFPSTRVLPDEGFIKEAAKVLASAEKPMIFMGDGVSYSDAQAELARVAEMLGAEVWGVDSGEMNITYDHPLYRGQTGHMFGSSSLPTMQKGDVNLICGTYVLPEVYPELGDIFAPGAKTLHIDLNAYQIAQNHPVDLGVTADPKLALAALADALESTLSAEQKRAAEARAKALGAEKQKKTDELLRTDAAARDAVPMQDSRFMAELAARLPDAEDVVIFDEALTCSPALTRHIPPRIPDQFFQTRGGSLGVGIPGALAAKLAYPDKTVIGFSGDGGSMYTIQALWTAAHHNIGAKFVICSNGGYKLLKLNIQQYWKEQGVDPHTFPELFNISGIDFPALAESMGVPGMRVERPDEAGPAIDQMLEHDGPFLIDMIVSEDV